MRKKVVFLFNHDAGHQVSHSVGIAAALAQSRPEIETIIAYGSDDIRAEISGSVGDVDALSWHDMALPPWQYLALAPLNRIAPVRRVVRLRRTAPFLKTCDLIVSTERTCLTLKRGWGDAGPAFAYIPHGSGDRNVAYHPALRDFDLMLLSGQKLVDQMDAHNIMPPEKCRIIGYPKYDQVKAKPRETFFANDNPVFLYNPHFDPHLSSWFDHGLGVLQYFADHPQYNLIVAPHVMLFFKKLHISLEYKTARVRPEIPDRFRTLPNILIDTDSPRLFDMSYTRSADAYIGDVSSQIYEFLFWPRACFFFDTHAAGEAGYEFWQNGPVVRDMAELAAHLPKWQDIAATYRPHQERLMAYTIDRSVPRSANERGADAIAGYLMARQSSQHQSVRPE